MVGRTGRYHFDRRLGSGGMGEVWRAWDTQTDRFVALKLVQQRSSLDAEVRARFLREARAVSRLQHPNIVPIHNFGEMDNYLFIDMALLDGEDLSERLTRSGPLPLETAIKILAQVATALDAAHAIKVVHRDIKPANIFIHPSGHTYVIDFGVAYLEDRTRLTRQGDAVGTLHYMAPERFDGVSHRTSDVYALACVLFECLTGTTVFTGSSPLRLIADHAKSDPPKLTVRWLPFEVRHQIDLVLARALAKDPLDRFQSAGEFITAVRTASMAPGHEEPDPLLAFKSDSGAGDYLLEFDTTPNLVDFVRELLNGAEEMSGSVAQRGRFISVQRNGADSRFTEQVLQAALTQRVRRMEGMVIRGIFDEFVHWLPGSGAAEEWCPLMAPEIRDGRQPLPLIYARP